MVGQIRSWALAWAMKPPKTPQSENASKARDSECIITPSYYVLSRVMRYQGKLLLTVGRVTKSDLLTTACENLVVANQRVRLPYSAAPLA